MLHVSGRSPCLGVAAMCLQSWMLMCCINILSVLWFGMDLEYVEEAENKILFSLMEEICVADVAFS